MRGRLFGVISAGAMAGMPLSTLAAGFLTEDLGILPMLIGIGVIYLVTTLSIFMIPAMRNMDKATIYGGG